MTCRSKTLVNSAGSYKIHGACAISTPWNRCYRGRRLLPASIFIVNHRLAGHIITQIPWASTIDPWKPFSFAYLSIFPDVSSFMSFFAVIAAGDGRRAKCVMYQAQHAWASKAIHLSFIWNYSSREGREGGEKVGWEWGGKGNMKSNSIMERKYLELIWILMVKLWICERRKTRISNLGGILYWQRENFIRKSGEQLSHQLRWCLAGEDFNEFCYAWCLMG